MSKKKTSRTEPKPRSAKAPPKASKASRTQLRAQAAADQENARLRDQRAAAPDGMTASERAMAASAAKAPRRPKPTPSAAQAPAAPATAAVAPAPPPKAAAAKADAKARAKAPQGRVSVPCRHDADLARAAKDAATSAGHIAFHRNGALVEFYLPPGAKDPQVAKAPMEAPLDESGVRSAKAEVVCTGRTQVLELVKRLTGKRPAELGLKVPGRAPGAGSDGAKRTAKAPRADGKMSGLDAAALVLAEAGRPMSAKDMVAEIQARGLWATKGATPEATIYAAIIREIAAKGKDARFRKHDRGLFVAARPA